MIRLTRLDDKCQTSSQLLDAMVAGSLGVDISALVNSYKLLRKPVLTLLRSEVISNLAKWVNFHLAVSN